MYLLKVNLEREERIRKLYNLRYRSYFVSEIRGVAFVLTATSWYVAGSSAGLVLLFQ